MKKSISAIIACLATTGCGRAFETKLASQHLAENVRSSLGCADSRSKVFAAYYDAYAKDPASLEESGLEADDAFPSKASIAMKKKVRAIHKLLTQPVATGEEEDESRDPVLRLIRLEMRSEVEPGYKELNDQLDNELVGTKSLAAQDGASCEDLPADEDVASTPPASGSRLPAAIEGAKFTMATAYQSCSVLKLPIMTASVQDLEGVKKSAKIDSVGYGRMYTDVKLLKKTDYYLQGQTYPAGCLNQDAKPLVYDYGGVPSIKSSYELDLFKNSGGGPALGIDCSAFVSTAAGVAGLRYNESTANKPVYTRFTSKDFIDPVKSKWTCYESVGVSGTKFVQPGDIASVKGHVVMVDEVGDDPFGLAKIRSASSCNSLDYRNFDFAVIQSSPSKNSIGINRYEARDYLRETTKMRDLFVAYAKASCLAAFDNKLRKPNTSEFGIIRHKGTTACKAPALKLVGQSCVEKCL